MLTHRRLQAHVFPLPLVLFLLCSTGIAWIFPTLGADAADGILREAAPNSSVGTGDTAPVTTAPQKAHEMLTLLQKRGGMPPPGYAGGRDFQNRERRLPRGRYREYDINPNIRGRAR